MITNIIRAAEGTPETVIEYTSDRPFRILQLTDMQIMDLTCTRNPTRDRQIKGAYFKEGVPDMDIRCFQYVYELAERVRPDLIVLTGDNIYGEFDDNGAMHKMLCDRMEEIGAPWAPIFGNHDNESRKGVRWQMEQFAKCTHCLFVDGHVTGHGNYAIRLRQNGRDVSTLYLLDTNGCRIVGNPWAPEEGMTEDNVDYDLICHEQGIYPDQIAWYRESATRIAAENGAPVPSLAFFHIPLKKYDEAFENKYGYEYKRDFAADRTEDGDFGVICEHNANRIDPAHDFYNMARSVGTVGFFTGHEHKNDACIHYDGATLAYGVKTGIATYYRDEAIGGTLIEIAADGGFTVTPQTCRKRFEIAMC